VLAGSSWVSPIRSGRIVGNAGLGVRLHSMSTSRDLLSLDVACDARAPAIVRTALSGTHDAGWPLDDALLVSSELVTNAVRHSGCRDTTP
jgi:hypothetical protein